MLIKCSKCYCKKDESYFSINQKTGEYYKICDKCREKQKIYRENHKEEINEKSKIHYENNKEEINEKHKIYRENHKEESKIYRENHKEEINEKHKIYRENHKEEIKKRKKIYYKNHKEEISEKSKINYENNKEEIKKRRKIYRKTYIKYENVSSENFNKLNSFSYNPKKGEDENLIVTCSSCKKYFYPTHSQFAHFKGENSVLYCPECSKKYNKSISKKERFFLDKLEEHKGIEIIRQYRIKGYKCPYDGLVQYDNKKLIFEYNGFKFHPKSPDQKDKNGNPWFSAKGYKSAMECWEHDREKEKIARENGYDFIEVWEDEPFDTEMNRVLKELDYQQTTISDFC